MQDASKIRNIAVLGHLGSGKTSLVEALYSITNNKPKGSVEKGNTVSDYLPEEHARLSSVRSSIVPINHNEYKINLIDIPGSDDFIGEAISSLRVVKGAILVIDAQSGIQVQTIKHWNMLRKNNIPTIIYVNKMDKEEVHFDPLLEDIRNRLGKNAIPFCYPMGHNDSFDGFINIVAMKARKYNGTSCEDAEIYEDKLDKVNELRDQMIEAVAQTSEELMDKFFAGEEISLEEVRVGLRVGVLGGELIPVVVGSATKNIGLHTLLDMFVNYLPCPGDLKPISGTDANGNKVERKTEDNEPFSAFVFKTIVDPYAGVSSIFKINSGTLKAGQEIYIPNLAKTEKVNSINVIVGKNLVQVSELRAGDIGAITKVEGLENSMTLCDPKNIITYDPIEYPTAVYFRALSPKSKNDEDKLSQVLAKIQLEDKCVEIKRNPETKQQLLGTSGSGHLNFILERMKNTYKLEINTEAPKIVYRETIKQSATAEGRYVKQSGGSGFYGVVTMEFLPTFNGPENVFTEEIFGGSVPRNYFPAVEKGFYEACEKGLLSGCPVIGVKTVLRDGKYHAVDSNELAFKMAAIDAFKKAYNNCKPVILEPIMKIVVTVNNDLVGDILSDLNTRRGKVQSMDVNEVGDQEITAYVPESEITEYVNDLKSITQGSATFSRTFYQYEECPIYVQEAILKELKAE